MKPKILLQVCCAPDATVGAERLQQDFDVGVFFYNPNIHPQSEYELRVEEMIRLAPLIGVSVLPAPYDSKNWFEAVKGLEHEPEKGARCHVCFYMRLQKTALAAKENGYDYFGTVLTVSPHKDAELINKIGFEIAEKTGTKYLESNFKKKDGFKRSIELSKQYNLYRQDYCGCIFSKKEREQK